MSSTDWLVVFAAAAAIAWVNWYFFVAGRRVVSATTATTPAAPNAPAEVHITVRGGYDPSTIRVAAGKPVRLVFDRQESSSCSEEVVFPAFGIRKFLPEGKPTTIEITPPAPGRYEFMCGMSMLRGAIVADA